MNSLLIIKMEQKNKKLKNIMQQLEMIDDGICVLKLKRKDILLEYNNELVKVIKDNE